LVVVFSGLQADANERSKTLKTIRREGRVQGAQSIWCKQSFPKKEKTKNKTSDFKFKNKNFQNRISKIEKS